MVTDTQSMPGHKSVGSVRAVPAYQALAEEIKKLGVPVFGLMSDDTALLVATLDAMGVQFHGARHENNAIAMADGYAAASGKLGIAIVGRGPATANAVHGAGYASRSGSKVLLIFGEASNAAPTSDGLGPDTKALNSVALLTAAGLPTFVATTPGGAQGTLAEAVAAAKRGSAVALLLPVNVQRGNVEAMIAAEPPARSLSAPAVPAPRDQSIAAAAALLQKSRRPLIIAGIGAHRAGARQALEKLADKAGAVLVTTLKAKDMFRGNPYDLGIIGSFSHSAARRLIDQADCVVVFGASMNKHTTSFGAALPPEAPLIHVDALRSHIGRWAHADVGIVADARVAAERLIDALPDRPQAEKPFHTGQSRRRLAEFNIAGDFVAEHTPRTVDPRALALELDRLLPPDRNLVYDAGNFLQIVPYVSVLGPDYLKPTNDFNSLGMGFGTALGFAKARPGSTTVLFIGDGGLLMTLGELETVVREDIPLVIVVMNDCAYGAELHYLKMLDMPVARSVFPDVDYAPVAQAFGFQTATIRSLDDLRLAAPMLQRPEGPILLDCKINASIAAPFMGEVVEQEKRKT